ncbi:MAG: lipocalin family protein [Vicinamibacterales bacterium]
MKPRRPLPLRAFALTLFLGGLLAMPTLASADGTVRSVPTLDLTRYAGLWYEVARYPNRFQKSCAKDVTAEYTLRSDGRITVVNACQRDDGSKIRAEGIARQAKEGGPNSQLKVRFAPSWLSFVPAVWGDYWVIDLAPDYSYAVVGDPSHDYLWILSRTPVLPDEQMNAARNAAAANGFDVAKLVPTPQTAR